MKLVNLNVSIKIDNSEKVTEFLNIEKADIITMQEVIRPGDFS